jgi:hypothetical protein
LSVAPHAATTQGRAQVLRVVADALAALA